MTVVKSVNTKAGMKDFIEVPKRIQGDDLHFIPRLNFEMHEHLGPKNPFFDHADHNFWVAYDHAGEPVGRISAQIDRLGKKDEGSFGFLEGLNTDVIKQLLLEAEKWLEGKDIKKVLGPFSLSINDESGVLTKGFERPPQIMMNHAPSFYADAIKAAEYTVVKKLIAYEVNINESLPRGVEYMARQARDYQGITERPVNMKCFKEEMGVIVDIFNDAWADNWGFIPMTEKEVQYMATNMKMIIKPSMARLAFLDNKPVAMIVALPNLNEAIHDLNGTVFPFGWSKLLWRLKIKGTKSCRTLLMGVRKDLPHQSLSSSLAALLVSSLQQAAQEEGFEVMEMSWVLEDNMSMRRLLEACGGNPYKEYTVFEKSLI